MNQRDLLAEILIAFGAYYDKVLSRTQIAMYVEDLVILTPDELKHACKQYRVNPVNIRFPLPSQLIAIAKGTQSPEDAGREVASLIIEAVHKFGWTNPDNARNHMGSLGWVIVQRMGGWSTFCGELTNDNLATLRAQIRDLATSLTRQKDRAPPSGTAIEDKSRVQAVIPNFATALKEMPKVSGEENA